MWENAAFLGRPVCVFYKWRLYEELQWGIKSIMAWGEMLVHWDALLTVGGLLGLIEKDILRPALISVMVPVDNTFNWGKFRYPYIRLIL